MADRTVTVKTSGGNYTTLNAALAGESADLVTNTRNLTIECYSMQDTTAASTGTGYTTSAAYAINITVPTAERHAGIWNTAKYYMNVANAHCLNIFEDFVHVTGLQFTHSSLNGGPTCGISISIQGATNKHNISKCIFNFASSNTYTEPAISIGDADALVDIWNCILYSLNTKVSSDNSLIVCDGNTVNVYSCTLSGGYKGLYRSTGTVNAYNTYAGNSVFADFNGTITKVNCGSEDGTADGTSPVTAAYSASTGAKFTNITAGSEDFHLQVGSSLIDAGNGTGMSFSDDIDGVTRTGTWDIGADEYVAAGGGVVIPVFMNQYRQRWA